MGNEYGYLLNVNGFVAWLSPLNEKSTGMANFEIAKPTKLPPCGPVLCQKYTFLPKPTTTHPNRRKNRRPPKQSTVSPTGRSTIKPWFTEDTSPIGLMRRPSPGGTIKGHVTPGAYFCIPRSAFRPHCRSKRSSDSLFGKHRV